MHLEPLNPDMFLWNIFEREYISNGKTIKFKHPTENVLFPGFTQRVNIQSANFYIKDIGLCVVKDAETFVFNPEDKNITVSDLIEHMERKSLVSLGSNILTNSKNTIQIKISKDFETGWFVYKTHKIIYED